MKRGNRTKIALLSLMLVIVGLILAPAVQALGSGYPARQGIYINDFAWVISNADRASIEKMLTGLKSWSGIEVVVVTVDSFYSYFTGDGSLQSFTTNLFNLWGVGDRYKNDGVVILVAIKDRECQITLGSGYGSQMDSAMQEVIDQNMIPHFKTGNYSAGIVAGVSGVIVKLMGKSTIGLPFTTIVSGGLYFWFLLCGITLIGFGAAGFFYMRTKASRWMWACLIGGGVFLLLLFMRKPAESFYFRWITSLLNPIVILLEIAALAYGSAGVSYLRSEKTGWGWAFLAQSGNVLLAILKFVYSILLPLLFGILLEALLGSLISGGSRSYHSSSGFRSSGGSRSSGGGRSFGGGAHGKW